MNPLDESCKTHDIAYSHNESLEARHQADLHLAQAAENRWRDSSAPITERIAALAVDKIMRFKVKRGMGVPLSKVISASLKGVKQHAATSKKSKSSAALVKVGVKAAKRYVQGKIVKQLKKQLNS